MDERICGLDVWDDCGRRVICKDLEMPADNFHVVERHSCIVYYYAE